MTQLIDIVERNVEGTIVIDLRAQTGVRCSLVGLHQLTCQRLAEGYLMFIVNLAECPWLDSSGLGELVKSLNAIKRQNGTLKLIEVPPQILQMLSITNLATFFDIDEAVTAAEKPPPSSWPLSTR